jgi:hypothetical protein
MNPWKIIGWIVLVVVVLTLGFCSYVAYLFGEATEGTSLSSPTEAIESPSQRVAPSYSLKVVSTECADNYGKNRADVTVKNTGTNTIPYAKAFVEFQDKSGKLLSAQDSYFSPTAIPPGATASTTVYSSGGGAKTCGLSSVQDGDGNAVTLQ